jgi:hypothetical protein
MVKVMVSPGFASALSAVIFNCVDAAYTGTAVTSILKIMIKHSRRDVIRLFMTKLLSNNLRGNFSYTLSRSLA